MHYKRAFAPFQFFTLLDYRSSIIAPRMNAALEEEYKTAEYPEVNEGPRLMITEPSFYRRLTVIVAKNRANTSKPEIRINPKMSV